MRSAVIGSWKREFTKFAGVEIFVCQMLAIVVIMKKIVDLEILKLG